MAKPTVIIEFIQKSKENGAPGGIEPSKIAILPTKYTQATVWSADTCVPYSRK